MKQPEAMESQGGFSLVEIVVALTIMLVAVMSLAAGTAAVARMSGGSADLVRRSASMDDYAGALSTMPWSELPSGTSCETISGEYTYERCVTVTDVSSSEKQLLITVTPENPRISPDTITIERGWPLGSTPLNVN